MPAVTVIVLIVAIVFGFERGWHGVHPCGRTSSASAHERPVTFSCLAR
jgi:hypothetical protein